MGRIAVFGGTFDPIHIGHLTMATSALRQFHLDQMVWVPTGTPPHKTPDPTADPKFSSPLTPFAHRFAMVERAIADYPNFHISAIEAQDAAPSYAIHTLSRLQTSYAAMHGECDWYWLIGLDTFQTLPHWHRSHEIALACTWLVATRTLSSDGAQLTPAPAQLCQQIADRLTAQIAQQAQKQDSPLAATQPNPTPNPQPNHQASTLKWHLLEMPTIPISSSLIRHRCQQGQSIQAFVPATVSSYIKRQNLYRYCRDHDE